MQTIAFVELINESIIAGGLILAVILVRLICKNAPKRLRCALWGLVGVLLICPFSIESDFSMVLSTEIIDISTYDTRPYITTGISAVDTKINGLIEEHYLEKTDKPGEPIFYTMTTLKSVWKIGMAVLAGYSLLAYLRLRRRVLTAMKVEEDVWICDEIKSPFVFGLFRPRVYLPSALEASYQEYVIAHERAHIRHLDHWWKLIGFAILVIHWFNPMVWIAYVLLCRDIELACDERVVRELDFEEKKAYSEALLDCSISGGRIAIGPLAFGEINVKNRIKTVLTYRKPALWMMFVVVAFGMVLAIGFLTTPKTDEHADIWDENRYTILEQKIYECTLSIPKEMLPDSIYTDEGHQFREREIVVYQTDTTIIYLDHVQLANESDEQLYFDFICTYEDIPANGKILTINRRAANGGYTFAVGVMNRTLRDEHHSYEEAVQVRGGGGGNMFELCVDTEVCKKTVGTILIDVYLNELYYFAK